MDSRNRTILKSVSFRLIATLTTFLLVYLLTGSLTVAGKIGVIECLSKLVLYYLHERMWLRISWGYGITLEQPVSKNDKLPHIRD
ncbi:MAG: DUF2061 domain-containing protein [Candidatus Bathyarchaeota archaeon]